MGLGFPDLQPIEAATSNHLVPLMYEELHKLAQAHLAGERRDHSLSATALLHEAYLRLAGRGHFENRVHFCRVASQVMRRVLIDNARRRKRLKRGNHLKREPLDPDTFSLGDRSDELLALDEVLQEFAKDHPRQAELVELRFFGGLNLVEVAKVLGVSLSTADRDWRYARAWLYAAMNLQI